MQDGAGRERKVLMEYRIIAGAVEERRQVYMSSRSAGRVKRGPRRGKTPAAQVKRNENEAKLRCARVLNANFRPGDIWLSLTYPKGKEPTPEQGREDIDRMIAGLRALWRKHGKGALRWVAVTSDRNPKTGAPVPLHHHLVFYAMPWEEIAELWDPAHLDFRPLDGSGDYTGVASYMVDNASEGSKKKWRTSRGMEKPVYTQPVPCAAVGVFRLPRNVRVREKRISDGESAHIKAAYIRFTRPDKMLREAKARRAGEGGNNASAGAGGNPANARGRAKGGG